MKTVVLTNYAAKTLEKVYGSGVPKKEKLDTLITDMLKLVITGKETSTVGYHFLKQGWESYKNVYAIKPLNDLEMILQSNTKDVIFLYFGGHAACPIYRY